MRTAARAGELRSALQEELLPDLVLLLLALASNLGNAAQRATARATLRNKQEHRATMEQRSSAAREEAAEARDGHLSERTEGRTCHVDM